ncbi:MAG: prefoldin subunit beta [Candidatus Methanomethylicota archaeon]|uniref:Prefoldin subunit beta n=1 Tax=Thermoproteota archaeon TaxID=2056631 RepID=A0A497EXT8_9CREN|nr:MAG: prefoldin subunit beta [Candidatus Verstraetearchaeota archaeon]RLE51996.1 MAG: prefoldin subunit beta [Candidatus Verstraetearchaeota archaeon]
MPPQVQNQVMRFQELQEQLKMIVLRKQQFELELREVEAAYEEANNLSPDTTIYKAVGVLLFKTDKDKVLKELSDRKEELDLRIKTLEKQEARLKQQLEELRKSIAAYMSQGPSSVGGS